MLPDFYRLEANHETAKNEGLADDNTTINLLKLRCLRSMKSILEDFSVISGLICNYDKTVIMPINPVNEPLLQEIRDLGFSISYSFNPNKRGIPAATK